MQTNVRTNEPDTAGGFETITTLEDLGRYRQRLREKWHVTQQSLSTRTGAITERKIARSRISEIENAKRDRVTERELRTYMRGLKCAPRHIDQVVKVLTQCTATRAREYPAGPDATRPATLNTYPHGLGGAEDDGAPLEEKSDDDPAAASHEDERRDRWPRVNTCITSLTASVSQLSRRRWQRHRITLATAAALVVVGLGVEFSLPRQSEDRPMSPGSSTALLVPYSAALIAEDASDLTKDATFPVGALVPVNQRFAKTWEMQDRLAGRGDAAGSDATQRPGEVTPITPCGVESAGQRAPGTAPQCRGGAIARPGSPDARGQGAAINRSRAGTNSGALCDDLLGAFGWDYCIDEWQSQAH